MRKTVLRSACIALLVGIWLALPGVAKAAPPPCGPKRILIVYADTDGTPAQLITALQGEADVTSVNLFDAASATPTLNDLNPYNLVLTWSNSPYADADGVGNVLADYQDSGVGLVIPMAFSFYGPGQPYGVNGRWFSGNYSPFTYSTNLDGSPLTLGTNNA